MTWQGRWHTPALHRAFELWVEKTPHTARLKLWGDFVGQYEQSKAHLVAREKEALALQACAGAALAERDLAVAQVERGRI